MVTLADGNFAAAVGPQVAILDGETGEVLKRKILEIPTGATTDIVFNGLQVRCTVQRGSCRRGPSGLAALLVPSSHV